MHYGAVCCICGFDFGHKYGEEFTGMIHIHHLKMISEYDDEYVVDPVADLRPVCPNCHMVIHSKQGGYSLDEVSMKLRESANII
jgi:predicted HNH restriction endonuclease